MCALNQLNEDDTTSSSRIFIKILFQEISEFLGLPKLKVRTGGVLPVVLLLVLPFLLLAPQNPNNAGPLLIDSTQWPVRPALYHPFRNSNVFYRAVCTWILHA